VKELKTENTSLKNDNKMLKFMIDKQNNNEKNIDVQIKYNELTNDYMLLSDKYKKLSDKLGENLDVSNSSISTNNTNNIYNLNE